MTLHTVEQWIQASPWTNSVDAERGWWPTGLAGLSNLRVTTPSELDAAVEIRRAANEASGRCLPDSLLRDDLDSDPQVQTYLLRDGLLPVGTVRGSVHHLATPRQTSLTRHAGAELRRFTKSNGRCLEVGRLAVLRSVGQRARHYPLAVLQNISWEADTADCGWIAAEVVAQHVGFYRRLGFEVIAEPWFLRALDSFLVPMLLNWTFHRERLLGHRLYFRIFRPEVAARSIQPGVAV